QESPKNVVEQSKMGLCVSLRIGDKKIGDLLERAGTPLRTPEHKRIVEFGKQSILRAHGGWYGLSLRSRRCRQNRTSIEAPSLPSAASGGGKGGGERAASFECAPGSCHPLSIAARLTTC